MSEYTPGTWFAAVTPRGVVVLPAESDPALTRAVAATLAAGNGLGGVLETLTGAFGTSLAAIPPFAVVTREGGETRIAVRGALSASTAGADAISGIGVTTWSERVIPGTETVTIETGDASGPGVLELPVADGIVLVSRVRVGDDDSGRGAAAAAAQDVPVVVPVPVPVVVVAVPAEPEVVAEPEPEVAPEREPDIEPEPAPVPAVEPEVNDALAPDPEPEATIEPDPEPEPEPEPVPEPEPALDDELWGATVVKSATDPAVRPPSAPIRTAERLAFMPPPTGAPVATQPGLISSVPGAVGTRPGDHDGMTISVEQSRAMRLAAGQAPAAPPAEMPAPVASIARIVLSTGREVVLDRTVVIGRRPSSTRVTGGLLPHLVSVESPEQDISRSHVEIRPEGDAIVVVDLNTTNGTLLRRIGHEPVQLHPGEPSIIVQGDVLELGDDVTVTFEGIA